MKYQALATDYDGTIAEHGHVDADTLDALRRLRAAGYYLIMVTGRELDDLQHVCASLDLFDYVVAENGALVYRSSDQQIQLLGPKPPERFVAELLRNEVKPISVGQVIVATWQPHQTVVERVIAEQRLDLQVILNKDAVMILPCGIDKAAGLKNVLAEIGISASTIVAVGDAENDLAMLQMCGYPVAVDNALPEVKRQVKHVTTQPRGAGVRELITELLG